MDPLVSVPLRKDETQDVPLRKISESQDEILVDFTASEKLVGTRAKKPVCCEGLSRVFVIYLITIFRMAVALILASVFIYQPDVLDVVPKNVYFLVLLTTLLSIRPFLGMTLVQSTFYLPLLVLTQLFSAVRKGKKNERDGFIFFYLQGVAYLIPHDPAFVAFIVFIGVFVAVSS